MTMICLKVPIDKGEPDITETLGRISRVLATIKEQDTKQMTVIGGLYAIAEACLEELGRIVNSDPRSNFEPCGHIFFEEEE